MELSIVIPAYNEARRLPPMLKAYAAYFTEKLGGKVEFIIVVNGTTDNTVKVAESIAETYPGIRILEETRPIGKGGAIMLGAAEARGNYIGFVDADGATAPEAFDDLYRNRDKAECLIASRWIEGAVVDPPQPLKRKISSRCFNFLVTTLFGFKIHDTQCGAKIVKGDVMKAVLPHLGETRWAFDVDLLFQVHRLGYRIEELPTVWQDKAGSKIRYVRSSLEMLIAIIRLRLLYSPFRFAVKAVNKFVRLFR